MRLPYIVRMRNSTLVLIGPFNNDADCTEWTERQTNGAGDDPRWQRIVLDSTRDSDGFYSVPVMKPDMISETFLRFHTA